MYNKPNDDFKYSMKNGFFFEQMKMTATTLKCMSFKLFR